MRIKKTRFNKKNKHILTSRMIITNKTKKTYTFTKNNGDFPSLHLKIV